ncbi:MAG: PAS domain S-box protein [Verrucomicrobiales bacterium]|nr:PAS domain S-box protein [Verrucomicrobiales bacterium]
MEIPDNIDSLKETVRQLQEQLSLAQENDRFRLVVESAPNGILVSNTKGEILMVNKRAEKIFGFTRKELMERTIDSLVPERFRKAHPGRRRGFHKDPEPRYMGHGRDLYAMRKDGTEFPVEIALTPIPGEEDTLVLSSIIDITERKRSEERLHHYSNELKRSNAEIVRVSEEEQRRIGQDLHDDLCSQLSGIGCLAKVIEQNLRTDRPEDAEMLSKVSGMISQAGNRAREIARGLVPTVLETQGLGSALREMLARNKELFSVECDLFIRGETHLEQWDDAIMIQFFRIAQEAVANAIKHSDAESIAVRLVCSEKKLTLHVQDDGKGMAPDHVADGMGLLTMRRRAEIVGADFDLQCSLGNGTIIECRLSKSES